MWISLRDFEVPLAAVVATAEFDVAFNALRSENTGCCEAESDQARRCQATMSCEHGIGLWVIDAIHVFLNASESSCIHDLALGEREFKKKKTTGALAPIASG
jgi:hypothetical protein